MAVGDDTDSGMESQEGSVMESRPGDETGSSAIDVGSDLSAGTSAASGVSAPTVGTSGAVNTVEFSPDHKPGPDDDEPETIAERLWGLTEMFPESVRNVTHTVAMTTKSSIKSFYGFSRSAFWVVFSSSIILFAPVIFEVERVQMEEAQRTQQKQMLLGPNTAVSGGGLPLMPPMHR